MLDDTKAIITYGTLIGLVLMFTVFAQKHGGGSKGKMETTEDLKHLFIKEEVESKPAAIAPCGSVSTSCRAEAKTNISSCEPKTAKPALDELLGNPLKTGDCEQVERDLAADCPSNCALDYGSMLVIAGKARYEQHSDIAEDGSCEVMGSKPVTVRARCVRNGS